MQNDQEPMYGLSKEIKHRLYAFIFLFRCPTVSFPQKTLSIKNFSVVPLWFHNVTRNETSFERTKEEKARLASTEHDVARI